MLRSTWMPSSFHPRDVAMSARMRSTGISTAIRGSAADDPRLAALANDANALGQVRETRLHHLRQTRTPQLHFRHLLQDRVDHPPECAEQNRPPPLRWQAFRPAADTGSPVCRYRTPGHRTRANTVIAAAIIVTLPILYWSVILHALRRKRTDESITLCRIFLPGNRKAARRSRSSPAGRVLPRARSRLCRSP